MQYLVECHRGATQLAGELVNPRLPNIGGLCKPPPIVGEFLEAALEGTAFGIQRVGLSQNRLREQFDNLLTNQGTRKL